MNIAMEIHPSIVGRRHPVMLKRESALYRTHWGRAGLQSRPNHQPPLRLYPLKNVAVMNHC